MLSQELVKHIMVMATTPYLPPYLYRPPGYHAWGLFLAASNVSETDKPDSASAIITITWRTRPLPNE
ncbi:MAG: hypothetical protein KAW00_00555 [Dehalococcoidia bacterium]|nr:hypothetical protein [Dehalococcoidia bacterium]